MRILVAVEPVDFRKGIDGLAALCRQALPADPLVGALFVLFPPPHALKCLIYDGQGFWLCQKRLSQGRFTGWPRRGRPDACAGSAPVAPAAVERRSRPGPHRPAVAAGGRGAER